MYALLLRNDERRMLERFSARARSNSFLPERIAREREALGEDFEDGHSVWSKHLDRRNSNISKLVARGEPVAEKLRTRLVAGVSPNEEELRLYEELVFYLLYDRELATTSGPRFRADRSKTRFPIGSRSCFRPGAPRTISSSSS
jgi:hypothetical protein